MKNKLYVRVAALSLLGSAAFAGTMGEVQNPNRWIIGGDVGYGYLSTTEPYLLPVQPSATNVVPDEVFQSRKIGNVVGGGYLGYDVSLLQRLTMGVEVGYKYMGQSKYFSTTRDVAIETFASKYVKVNQQAVDFLVTGKIYLYPGLHLIGKAGAAYVRAESKENSYVNIAGQFAALDTSPSIWRIRPEFDVGVGYGIYDNISLNLMYTYIGGADANVTGLFRFYNVGPDSTPAVFRYNALTAGLSYAFDNII